MKIDKLSSKQNSKFITITMSCEDARDISNALWEAQKINKKYRSTYVIVKTVFDMVKYGMVRPETVAVLHEIEKERDSERETKEV